MDRYGKLRYVDKRRAKATGLWFFFRGYLLRLGNAYTRTVFFMQMVRWLQIFTQGEMVVELFVIA